MKIIQKGETVIPYHVFEIPMNFNSQSNDIQIADSFGEIHPDDGHGGMKQKKKQHTKISIEWPWA